MTLDLSNRDALKAVWAAMVAMTQDIHAPQDTLTVEQWEEADRIFAELTAAMEAAG